MKVVVLNAGSGSQKCSLFELPNESLPDEPVDPIWEVKLDSTAPDQPQGKLLVRATLHGEDIEVGAVDESAPTAERIEYLLRMLCDGPAKVVGEFSEVDVVGHRVVHGGAEFDEPVRVNVEVEAAIERFASFAPLHNRSNLTGIRVARELFGKEQRQFAVFDTAFHRTLSTAAATYAGPSAWLEQGIRRYGFHGTSFRYASGRAAQLLGRINDPELRLILCHLGGGCSLAAVRGNASIDTTMGFSPLDGVAMCTRSGAVDPGILLYLMRQGLDVDRLETILNKESGLAGLSGLPGDTRVILSAVRSGNERAKLAMDVFIHRLRAGIGTMLASLGGCDVLVFTDVIGETEPPIRAAASAPFAFMGLEIDASTNEAARGDVEISTPNSKVRVFVIKTLESWQVGQETLEALHS